MRPEIDLQEKLEHLLEKIPPEGYKQVQELIASVVNEGGISEGALIKMVNDQLLRSSLRLKVCWLLPRLGVEGVEKTLESLMNDPSDEMREEAAMGLGLLPKDDVVEILLNSLGKEGSKSVRLAILHALGILSSPQSANHLMAILQNLREDDEIRADAAEALSNVNKDGIVDLLIISLQDNSPLVRYSAAYALGQQGDDKAIPALRHLAAFDLTETPWGTVASSAHESIEILLNKHL